MPVKIHDGFGAIGSRPWRGRRAQPVQSNTLEAASSDAAPRRSEPVSSRNLDLFTKCLGDRGHPVLTTLSPRGEDEYEKVREHEEQLDDQWLTSMMVNQPPESRDQLRVCRYG